ncbi:MAG TPA: hypothetical protein VJU52_13150 [Flavobacterium sp.]|nr:hypothetical protein [Flavobacterium sp.]
MIREIEEMAVKINKDSSIPKYIQVAETIIGYVQEGKLKVGQRIPSIKEFSSKRVLTRDTIEKTFKLLRDKNIIFLVKGVGYFVTDNTSNEKIKVLFLINKVTSYKLEVYNSFIRTLGVKADVRISLYNYDEKIFVKTLKYNLSNFDYFVIMPHFRDKAKQYVSYTAKAIQMIQSIPKEKLIITDNSYKEIPETIAAVYQDYREDIIHAMRLSYSKLIEYKKIVLVYPLKSVFPYPIGILEGFNVFCAEHNLNFEVVNKIYDGLEFEAKHAYIIISEEDLLSLLKQIKAKNLTMGKDVGIISYNETPLKELLGISIFSTDFETMGKSVAKMILTEKKDIIKNPFNYIERQSL